MVENSLKLIQDRKKCLNFKSFGICYKVLQVFQKWLSINSKVSYPIVSCFLADESKYTCSLETCSSKSLSASVNPFSASNSSLATIVFIFFKFSNCFCQLLLWWFSDLPFFFDQEMPPAFFLQFGLLPVTVLGILFSGMLANICCVFLFTFWKG